MPRMLADASLGLKPKGGGGGLAVLFPGALGDAVCFEPTLDRLAAGERPVLYARGAAAGIASLFPCRPELRSLDSPAVAALYAPLREGSVAQAGGDADGLDELRVFARVVSFTGSGDGAAMERLRALGATVAPFPREIAGEHACDAFLRRATGDPGAVARAPRLVAPVPVVIGALPAEVAHRPLLAIHPGAGATAKRAPDDLLAALAARWKSHGGAVCAVLGPAEADLRRRWTAVADSVVEPADALGLAGLLARAAAFLGGDSGPGHVAAALGIPGAALFVTTDPASWGPRGAAVKSIAVAAGAAEERAWGALLAGLP